MIYLSCQPAIPKFLWEVEVYVNNFIEMGVNPNDIHVVLGLEKDATEIPDQWKKLHKHFRGTTFFYIKDTRPNTNTYQPSIQAHLLAKYWMQNSNMQKQSVFFHDSDFIFTKPFDFEPFLQDDIWYFSDTCSYIGANYIRSKGEEVFDKMMEIAGLDPQFVIDQEKNSGGAQKLLKNVPTSYWVDAFNMQIKLWNEIPPISRKIADQKQQQGEYYMQLQHWTMSMWAELWTAWKYGFEVNVPKEFNFHFAIDKIDRWLDRAFFHNSGVVGPDSGIFFKGMFDKQLPYGYEIQNPNKDVVGWKYFEYIQEVGKKSVLV
jgi:hypothetical protein